jgi:hypothetical protein
MAEMTTFKSPTNIRMAPGGSHGLAEYGSDDNLLVCFYNRPVNDSLRSVEEGRPIYKDVIHVRIQQPGEMLNIIDRPVVDNDKRRFLRQWTAFVHDRTQVPEGTPIDHLFPNHPAVAENLRGYGVYTVEQCSKLSASAIDTIGRGGQEYVNRANKYLEQATTGKSFHIIQKELDDEKQKNRIMEQQIAQLKSQVDALSMKFNDPIRNAEQPPYISGYDVQSERINANAETIVGASSKKKGRRPTTVEDKITDPFAQTETANATD